MEIKEVIGIDASKLKLDCCLHNYREVEIFDNTLSDIGAMVAWSLKTSGVLKKELLFVFEHAGLYTHHLIHYLGAEGCLFHVVPGLEIKRSLGMVRGKDDKADAERIALYGYRARDEVKSYQLPGESLVRLKRLMSMRRKLVAQRAGHIATLKDQKRIFCQEQEPVLFEVQQRIIHAIGEQIAIIKKELEKIIVQDRELYDLYKLLISIKGVGFVTARFLIVYTVGFTPFETWRKFASYYGIAPFPHRSRTSVKGRTKVSHMSNKEGKTLLHLCAVSSIQFNPEMKANYQRRVEQGKNKMSTLNIIRNKILARAFAVVNRGTPYVDTMKYAA